MIRPKFFSAADDGVHLVPHHDLRDLIVQKTTRASKMSDTKLSNLNILPMLHVKKGVNCDAKE